MGEPLYPWVWLEHVWHQVHSDFARPFRGKKLILIGDAHSKRPNIHELPTITAGRTIIVHRYILQHMVPVVSNNWPQFTSQELVILLLIPKATNCPINTCNCS